MTAQQWKFGRQNAELTQVQAARVLGVSQPYLSQLEKGSRLAAPSLELRAAQFYKLTTALPLPKAAEVSPSEPDCLQGALAALGYPKFTHVLFREKRNPAEVVFDAITHSDLDTRLVEALPWVMSTYVDLNWQWLCDGARLRNVQNRLGYVVYLAKEGLKLQAQGLHASQTLTRWEQDLENARLAAEGTLCRDSMPNAERLWLRVNRPQAAEHWNLLTNLMPDQLVYATA